MLPESEPDRQTVADIDMATKRTPKRTKVARVTKTRQRRQAVSYLRVSSRGQVKGDGFPRQRAMVARYAKAHRIEIVDEYREAFTGTDHDRPEFQAMVAELMANGVRTVLVERLDRFARDLGVQMQLLAYLLSKGITLIAADTGQDVTAAMREDPMAEAMVLMQGVFAQLEKKMLVAKLRKARQRTRARTGRCEGRKPFGERPGEQETLARMRQLYRKRPKRKRLSFGKIARTLDAEERPTRTGARWSRQAVAKMLLR